MRNHILRVVVIFVITVCLLIVFFGLEALLTGTIDIQLHDTYFVTQTFGIGVVLFSLLGFISFISTEAVNLFRDRSSNLFLLAFTALLIFIVFYFNWGTGNFFDETGGWVVYPPGEEIKNELMRRYQQWTIIFISIKTFLIVLSLLLLYRSFFDKKLQSPK